MPTLTKHSGNSSKYQKVLNRAVKLHPNFEWVVTIPDIEILKNYGDGFLIIGRKGLREAVYFVLFEDPRVDNWINMIASQLTEDEDARS